MFLPQFIDITVAIGHASNNGELLSEPIWLCHKADSRLASRLIVVVAGG